MRFRGMARLLVLTGLLAGSARAADLADVLGVAHVAGEYYLTNQDFMDEGANQVLGTSSRVINLYLTSYDDSRYPWNSHWPANLHSMVEMAQTPYFKSVFAKPFSTYIITAYSFGRSDHYWTAGINEEQNGDETRQFYDLTKYLLTTYRGTGKTFVLQHWEGDWALRNDDQNHIYDWKYTPTPLAIRSMIEWINARQAGIVKARGEVRDTDVHVYGATEANRVKDQMAGRPGVVNMVLPHTTVDLAAYSSYESNGSVEEMSKAVDFFVAHLPPTAAFGHNAHSVYIGEYGGDENGLGAKIINLRINNVVQVARTRGLPWVIYWEIYCNELKDDSTQPPVNGKNDAVKGYWMIKPDGIPATSWQRYRQLIATSEPERATSAGVKARLSLLYHDTFDRVGAEIGVGWAHTSHYGPLVVQGGKNSVLLKLPQAAETPWGSGTLDLTNQAVLGRALNVGEYFEFTMRRLGDVGMMGVELFDSDQLRQGGGMEAGSSQLYAWTGAGGEGWVPFSIDDVGDPLAFNWSHEHTLGVRFDSADGYFDTFTYYVDGRYAGSWLIKTGDKTLDRIGFFGQSHADGSTFEFSDLRVYGQGHGR